MKIDELPIEMLMEILSYMPTLSEISLINRLFYDIVSNANDSKILLQLNNHSHLKWLQSIQKSKRKISRVEFDERFVKLRAHSIIGNFSATIKHLKYVVNHMNPSALMEMLSLIPNVEHLHLIHIFRSPSTHELRCVDYLNMMKLKSLAIYGSDFMGVLKWLPVGVLNELSLLTELQIHSYNWDKLAVLINRQLNIKKFKGQGIYFREKVNIEIFDKLKLESLELEKNEISNDTLATILSKQSNLKSLILLHELNATKVDDRLMDAIADLSELETLAIDIDETTEASFVKFRKLKKLKDLALRCDCMNDHFRAKIKILAESDNSSVIKLAIGVNFTTSFDLLARLAQSAPHLKHLTLLTDHMSNVVELDAILTHFRFIESLKVSIKCPPLVNQSDYFNPKLKELTLTCPIYEEWLTIFFEAYPNLQKLNLDVYREYQDAVSIASILNGFKRLELLTFNGWFLTATLDLDHLCKYKHNLKYVSVRYFRDYMLTDEIIEKLNANFDVVTVDREEQPSYYHYRTSRGRILHLAVDQHTMKRERLTNWAL